jgi:hypothetical protein
MDGRDVGGRDMDGQWMTYTEAAARLGVTPEAVRRRAFRSNWARQPGNDGRTRVRVPDDVPVTRSPTARPDAPALEAHIATLKTDIERLTAELAGERAARQVDQDQLVAERTARQADQEQHQEQLAAERAARQADQDRHQDQLVAARAAADRATAELVELARRLAEIAETQTAAETAEAEPEPPRRSAVGRAWRWFLRN